MKFHEDGRFFLACEDVVRILTNWRFDERLLDQFVTIPLELDAIGKMDREEPRTATVDQDEPTSTEP